MSSEEDTSIQLTQSSLGKYVTKPNLSEKLLKKPPFRFLHDIVCVVVNDSGYLKGLFTDNELLSANVKEREVKVAFLNKLIVAVKTTTKADLKVRASKIIAGLEPIETNKLLQAIAKAIEEKIDSTEYVNSLSKAPKEKPAKSSSKSSSNKDKTKGTRSVSKSSTKASDDSKTKLKEKSTYKEPPSSTRSNLKSVPEKKIREKKDAGKKSSKDNIPSTDRNERKKDEIKSKTIEKVSTKISPKDKEKKSPNTIETIKEDQTLAPEGDIKIEKPMDITANLVQNDENDDANTKDFAINLVSVSKDSIDKTEVKETDVANAKESIEVKPIFERPKTAKISKNMTQLIKDNQNSAPDKQEEQLPLKTVEISNSITFEQTTPKPRPPTAMAQPIVAPRSSLRPPSARPGTARPAAPRLRPSSALPPSDSVATNGNVKVVIEQFRGKGSLQGEEEDDDEETVVVQETLEDIQLLSTINSSMNDTSVTVDAAASKSHLVGQIMAQVGQDDSSSGVGGRGGKQQVQVQLFQGDKPVAELGASIQTVTQSSNTLGQLMGYLHEDIDAMRAELEHWSQVARTTMAAADKRRTELAERTRPLRAKLQEVEVEIQRQKEEITTLQSTIHLDQRKIDTLVRREVAGINDGGAVPIYD